MGKQGCMIWLFVLLLCFVLGQEQPLPAVGRADLPAEGRFVALTFDDGPRRDTTSRLLDGLRERGASATFFLVGEQIAGNEDLLRRMQAEGHQVGNHSWSHANLKEEGGLGFRQEVEQTNQLLQEVLGQGGYWLRPPYGFLSRQQRQQLSVPVVKWSVDPEDWKLRDSGKDVAAVLAEVQPGDIILMHDSIPATVDAALEIVDTLQAEGYTFVTVEELLALYGVEAQPGVFYCSAESIEE